MAFKMIFVFVLLAIQSGQSIGCKINLKQQKMNVPFVHLNNGKDFKFMPRQRSLCPGM